MEKGKVVSLEDRIPKLKQQRRKKVNRRIILLLSLFFSLIVIVAYIQSPLSRIKNISVKGNEFFSTSEIIKSSGLSLNMNIWKVNKKEVSAKLEGLPEIKQAVTTIIWPNSLEIQVTEYKKIAYLKLNSAYCPILENGSILMNQKTGEAPINAPILIGFQEGSELNDFLIEMKKLPAMVLNSISEVHYEPTSTDPEHIVLYMNDGFEVSAVISSFSEKMSQYPSIISQLDPTKKGVIDLEVGSYFKAYGP